MKKTTLPAIFALCLVVIAASVLDFAFAANSTIKEVQERLSVLGYDPGPADGLPGKRTRQAIEQFQRDSNLQVTGDADAATLKRLDIGSGGVVTNMTRTTGLDPCIRNLLAELKATRPQIDSISHSWGSETELSYTLFLGKSMMMLEGPKDPIGATENLLNMAGEEGGLKKRCPHLY